MRPFRLPRFLPTRRLALVTALFAPVWLLSYWRAGFVAALLLTGLLVAIIVSDILRLPNGSAFSVTRDLPPTAGIGDQVTGYYHVAETASASPAAPRALTLHDAIPAAVERRFGAPDAAPTSVAPPALRSVNVMVDAGGAGTSIPFVLTGRARGRYPLGPVVLRVHGPLGLVRRTLRYLMDDAITVTPSIAGLRRFRLLSVQHRLRDAGVRTIRRRGEGASFTTLREYVLGDDPRHIDWKASARRDKLITREFAAEQGQTVMIAVDAGRMMTQLAGPLPRFEYALSSALVLADIAIHSGDQVGLIVFDDAIRAFVPAMRGATALTTLRDALAPVVPTMAEPDYAAAFRALAARHRKRSLLVLFTDVIDARASQALIAYTARSAARHLPVVVALRNDTLVHAAVPASGASTAQLYESAAAEELLLARHAALLDMRRAGVSVLDVSPHAMTAAVINHYLEIKARQAL
ncbi:MAG TPA: DUF58 domain-containing protein [Gemmatimonadaceae bacterium]|nr:DUF58 domain-containing protein [Gemmatimonadaceae bacterium]